MVWVFSTFSVFQLYFVQYTLYQDRLRCVKIARIARTLCSWEWNSPGKWIWKDAIPSIRLPAKAVIKQDRLGKSSRCRSYYSAMFSPHHLTPAGQRVRAVHNFPLPCASMAWWAITHCLCVCVCGGGGCHHFHPSHFVIIKLIYTIKIFMNTIHCFLIWKILQHLWQIRLIVSFCLYAGPGDISRR